MKFIQSFDEYIVEDKYTSDLSINTKYGVVNCYNNNNNIECIDNNKKKVIIKNDNTSNYDTNTHNELTKKIEDLFKEVYPKTNL